MNESAASESERYDTRPSLQLKTLIIRKETYTNEARNKFSKVSMQHSSVTPPSSSPSSHNASYQHQCISVMQCSSDPFDEACQEMLLSI